MPENKRRGTTPADVALLRDAAEDVEDIVRDLNDDRSTCGSCGLNKYDAFDEHIVANTLKRLPGRLRNAAELLENVQKYGRIGGRKEKAGEPVKTHER